VSNLNFEFNGERRDEYLIVNQGGELPAWAPVERNLLEALGVPGAYLQDTTTKAREMTIPITIKCRNKTHLQKIKEDMAAWLVHEQAKPLIFDWEPDRIYYALVNNELGLEEKQFHATGSIQFIDLNGYKSSFYEKTDVSSVDATLGRHVLKIKSEGTTSSPAVFEMKMDGDYTQVLITDGTNINAIGEAVNLEDYQAAKREVEVLSDELASLTPWTMTTGDIGIDGMTGGTFKTNGYSFQAASFGTNNGAWHGAHGKRAFPNNEELENFIVETVFEFANPVPGLYGKVELYLFDASGAVIGKLALKNSSGDDTNNIAEVRAGDRYLNRYLISNKNYDGRGYKNFYGILRIVKSNNHWEALVGMIDKETGQQHTRVFETFDDIDKLLTKKLASIGIYIAQYADRATSLLAVHRVRVAKINTLTTSQIPYIVKKDDIVTFDHVNKVIRVNGLLRNDLKAFGGEWFPLPPGTSQIQAIPNVPITCTYRERFL
jgi:predicted phage tail component-like protein